MNSVTKLESGVAVEVKTLKLEGGSRKWVLAVASRPAFGSQTKDFVYYCEEDKLIASFYSGGITGVGANDYNTRRLEDTDYTIETTDLETIMRMGEEADLQRLLDSEAYRKRQVERVERINALPTEESVIDLPDGSRIMLKRSEASIKNNGHLEGGYVRAVRVKDGVDEQMWLSNFLRKDGVIMQVKANRFAVDIVGRGNLHQIDPVRVLRKTVEAMRNFERRIRNTQ